MTTPLPASPAVRYQALTGPAQEWSAVCAQLLATDPARLTGLLAPGTIEQVALAEDPRSHLREPGADPLAPAGPTKAESAAAAIRDLALALATPAHPATPERIARAGGHWRRARVLLPADPTAPDPAWTTPAADDPPALAAVRPILAALPDRPAAGFAYLLAQCLLGAAPPARRGVAIPVLFDQRDGGSVAELRVHYVPHGPPGLYPDPAVMPFLATDDRFAAALTNAWRLSPLRRSGCVVWSVTQAGAPCNDLVHGSLGAAFGVALGELHRRGTWRRRWLRFRALRPASAVTGVLGDRGELLPVAGVANKLRAAGEAGLRVIAPKPAMSEVTRHADEHRVTVAFAGDLSEATRLAHRLDLRRITTWAVVAVVLLAGAPAAAWTSANAINRERAAGAAQVDAASRTLAAASLDAAGRDPQLSDVLAASAAHLALTAEAEQGLYQALTRPAIAAVPAGIWTRFTPEGELLAAHLDGTLRRLAPDRHLPAEALPRVDLTDPATPRYGAVAASPDGGITVWGDGEGYLHRWDHARSAPIGEPIRAHRSGIAVVEVSPDGRLVATVTNPSGGPSEGFTEDSQTVRLWDLQTGQLVRGIRTDHTGYIQAVAFSPDGATLATGSGSGTGAEAGGGEATRPTIAVWDVHTGAALGGPAGDQPVTALAFHPDRTTLAAGRPDGTLSLWDSVSGAELVGPVTGHTGEIRALTFSADGTVLASAGTGDNRVRLWEAATGESLADSLDGHQAVVTSLDFSPDDRRLASTDQDGILRLWEVDPARVGLPYFDRSAERTLVAYQPGGQTLAVAGWDGVIQLWQDAGTSGFRRDLGVIPAGHGQIRALAFAPSGVALATGGDGSVRLWDPETGELEAELTEPDGAVRALAFAPDGTRLAAASDAGVQVWSLEPDRLEWTVPAGDAPVTGLAFGPDGALLVGGDRDGRVSEWDPADGTRTRQVPGHDGPVTGVAVAPDGSSVATAGADGTVALWEPDAEVPRARLTGHDWAATGLAYHPDGEVLATSGLDGLRRWDVETGRLLDRHPVDAATSLAFVADGERIVAANAIRRVAFWSTTDPGGEVELYPVSPGDVTAHAVSPDGALTAALSHEHVLLPPAPPDSAGEPDTSLARTVIRVYDSATRRPVRVIVLPQVAGVLSFAGDSASLDMFTADGRLRSWRLATGEQTRDPAVFPERAGVQVAVATGGQWAAVAADEIGRIAYPDGEVITVVDLVGGQTAHELAVGPSPVTAMAASAGGILAAGFDNGDVRLWDIASGTEHGGFHAGQAVTALAFHPDGDRLLAAADGARWWTVAGAPATDPAPAATAGREITALAVSPSGEAIAIGGGGELTIHSVDTGTVIHTVRGWGGTAYAMLGFDPTGATLHVSMTDMVAVGALDVSYSDRPLQRLCDRIGRTVTVTDWAGYVPESERIDPGPVCGA